MLRPQVGLSEQLIKVKATFTLREINIHSYAMFLLVCMNLCELNSSTATEREVKLAQGAQL